MVWTSLGALVLFACAIANFAGASQSSAIRNGVRVPAHVVNVTRTQSDGFMLLLRYSANGHPVQEHAKYESSARTVPSIVEVGYQRNDPSVVEVLGQPTRSSITGVILAALAGVFGVLLFLQTRVILKGRAQRRWSRAL
jgi:hypothetical protein